MSFSRFVQAAGRYFCGAQRQTATREQAAKRRENDGRRRGGRAFILGYLPLRLQNRRPHFRQLYGLIQANLSSLSNRFLRRDRAIIMLSQLGHLIGDKAIVKCSHTLNCPSINAVPCRV